MSNPNASPENLTATDESGRDSRTQSDVSESDRPLRPVTSSPLQVDNNTEDNLSNVTTTDIKKAFKDADADQSRALHEKKLELARKRRDRQQRYEAATNPKNNDPASESTGTKNLLGPMDVTSDVPCIEIETGSEMHKKLGDYVKSIIYGGLDGIITTFAVVAGVQGANLKAEVILVLGFANLVADGLSMGVGDFLSEKAEIDFARSEREREKWEFDNYKEGEIQEMIEIYESKGISTKDATIILRTMAKYPDFFIDHMMIQELDINPPDEDANPMKNGFATLCSFLLFGCVPLLAYLIFESVDFGNGYDPKFLISIILTLLCLAVLGGIKGKMTDSSIIKSALFVTCNGAAAAGASFLIGWGLGELTGISSE